MTPSESFSIKDLGETISKMLDLSEGETIRILRDKMDANRLLVQVIRESPGKGPSKID